VLYFLGGCLGPGVALVVGGLTLDWAEQLNAANQLGFLHDEPWRFVMLAAAVPGIAAAAAVIAFVRDSRDPSALRTAKARTESSETLIDELRAKPLLYLGLLGGTGVVVAYFAGLAAWWPTHALRSFGWPLDRSGVYFGALLAGGALTGVLAGGSISAALMRRFGDAGNGIALMGLSIAAAIPMIGAPLIGTPELQLAAIAVAIAFTFAISSLAPVGCQLAAGPNMRGRVTALYAAITSIIGAGLGPFVVAWISRLPVAGGTLGLGRAFAVVGLLSSVIMIAGYSLVVRQGRGR